MWVKVQVMHSSATILWCIITYNHNTTRKTVAHEGDAMQFYMMSKGWFQT